MEEERRDLDNMYSDIPLEGRAPVRMPRDLPSLPKHQIGTLPQLIAGWGGTSKAATAREKHEGDNMRHVHPLITTRQRA